jgi:hypothetical protein
MTPQRPGCTQQTGEFHKVRDVIHVLPQERGRSRNGFSWPAWLDAQTSWLNGLSTQSNQCSTFAQAPPQIRDLETGTTALAGPQNSDSRRAGDLLERLAATHGLELSTEGEALAQCLLPGCVASLTGVGSLRGEPWRAIPKPTNTSRQTRETQSQPRTNYTHN